MIYQTTKEMLLTLGKNLQAERLAENITQQMAADRSGISLKAVRNIEAGRNASTFSLLAYCRTLRKTDWLMSLAPPEVDDSLFDKRKTSEPRRRAAPVRKDLHG